MHDIDDSPPRRSREQLEAWVNEFEQEEHYIAGRITIAPQEDDGGQDTGLVILRLRNTAASIYMKPRGYDDPFWEATLTAHPDEQTMSVHDITSFAAEVVIAGNLCAFLQWKSLEWDRESGQRDV
jgi:hypothetical protein